MNTSPLNSISKLPLEYPFVSALLNRDTKYARYFNQHVTGLQDHLGELTLPLDVVSIDIPMLMLKILQLTNEPKGISVQSMIAKVKSCLLFQPETALVTRFDISLQLISTLADMDYFSIDSIYSSTTGNTYYKVLPYDGIQNTKTTLVFLRYLDRAYTVDRKNPVFEPVKTTQVLATESHTVKHISLTDLKKYKSLKAAQAEAVEVTETSAAVKELPVEERPILSANNTAFKLNEYVASLPVVMPDNFADGDVYQVEKFKKQLATVIAHTGNWEYYFKWFPDERGRKYTKSILSLHSFEYIRALSDFAREETITPEGFNWLMIDIANNCKNFNGAKIDKIPYTDRLLWAELCLKDVDPSTAKNPTLFAKSLHTLQGYLADPENFTSGVPVSLDASASGAQILSALTRCKVGGRITGLQLDPGEDIRFDAYQEMYDDIAQAQPSIHKLKIKPEEIKKATMTSFYSSKRAPMKLMKTKSMLNQFYRSRAKLFPGADRLAFLIESAWNPEWTEYAIPSRHGVSLNVVVKASKQVDLYFKDCPDSEPVIFDYKEQGTNPSSKELVAK